PDLLLTPVPPRPELPALSLHDALPISASISASSSSLLMPKRFIAWSRSVLAPSSVAIRTIASAASLNDSRSGRTDLDQAMNLFRSEEHTSELQSRFDLVCRPLLDKQKK